MTEQKQVHSQITFQLIVDYAPNAMILVNRDGKIAYANIQAEKLFRYSKSEFMNQGIEMLIPARFGANHETFRNQFFKAPDSRAMGAGRDLFARRKDGTEFPVEIGLNPLVTEEGTMVLAAVIDISERKKAEEQLRLVVESAPNAMVLVNTAGEIIMANIATERLFGYKREELMSQKIEILIPERFKGHHPGTRGSFFASPQPREMGAGRDLYAARKDGSEFPVEIGLNPIEMHDGKMVLASVIDISERKKKQAAELIEKSEKRFRSLIENGNDAITLITAEGTVLYQSRSTERILGYSFNDTFHKNAFEFFHPDDHENLARVMQEVLAYPAQPVPSRNRLKHKDGHYVWMEGTMTNLLADENINALVVNFRDITDRKLAEEKILKLNLLYSFLSNINQAIVHVQCEQELFNEVCRVAIDIGGFDMVWIGLIDGHHKKIHLAAQGNARPEEIKLFESVDFSEDGPVMSELLAGRYFLSNETQAAPVDAKWKEFARISGFGSCIALPITKSGKTIGIINIYCTPVNCFGDEEIALLVEAAGDISYALDVFQKEKLLTLSERRLREAQQIAHLGDWEMAYKPQKVTWSDELFQIFGFEPGAVAPAFDTFLSLVHPNDVADVKQRMEMSKKSLQPDSMSIRLVLANATDKNVFATVKTETDSGGKPIRLYGTVLDITEITKKEEALTNSENRFRDFFQNAPEALAILDLHQGAIITGYNNNAIKLLKYKGKDLINKNLRDISPVMQPDGQSSREKSTEYLKTTLAGGKPVFEWVVLDAAGKEIICEVRLAQLSGMHDNMLMASFVDITERKNNETIREKMTIDLVQRNKGLEQFMYIVSHNLRAPVANLLGIADLLQNEKLSAEDSKTMLKGLDISAQKLDVVIKDLNEVLQIKREVREQKETVNFALLAEDIKLAVAAPINEGQATIKYNFDAVESFFTIKSYMYSVFYNLISNSIKYRRPDVAPVIEITSALANNHVILTFKDNGLGIDLKRKSAEVFGLYKRFHAHTEGKGMGLYMVKTQVEIMGGSITVASEVNKGSIFTITFKTDK